MGGGGPTPDPSRSLGMTRERGVGWSRAGVTDGQCVGLPSLDPSSAFRLSGSVTGWAALSGDGFPIRVGNDGRGGRDGLAVRGQLPARPFDPPRRTFSKLRVGDTSPPGQPRGIVAKGREHHPIPFLRPFDSAQGERNSPSPESSRRIGMTNEEARE